MGYQYVITNRNHSLEGHWEVAYKGRSLKLVLSSVPVETILKHEYELQEQRDFFR